MKDRKLIATWKSHTSNVVTWSSYDFHNWLFSERSYSRRKAVTEGSRLIAKMVSENRILSVGSYYYRWKQNKEKSEE